MAGAGLLAFIALLQASPPPASLTTFLQRGVGLDATQLAAVERGEAVVKVLETRDRRVVTVFGIVTTATPRSDYLARARDFMTSLATPSRTRFGIFSDPPSASDVAAVQVTPRDVEDMRGCKPGDCVAKLPASDMQRVKSEVNWSGSAAEIQAQLSAFARRRMVEYVSDYRARGDSALAVYDDRGTTRIRASEAFQGVLAESPYLYAAVPSLQQYFASYPRAPAAGVTSVIFWSEDALPRLRPILSITHQVVYSPPEYPLITLIAAKQIYANHYFESAFDVTSLVDRNGGGSYVLVLRSYRFDNLPGGILNIRGRAIGALRDQLMADLKGRQTR
jgi:hypothetical protein